MKTNSTFSLEVRSHAQTKMRSPIGDDKTKSIICDEGN